MGTVIEKNMIANTCRESGDHGNFNSWDRKPWVWLQDSADPSSLRMVPQQSTIHNNFIIRTSFQGPSKNLYCIDHGQSAHPFLSFFPPIRPCSLLLCR